NVESGEVEHTLRYPNPNAYIGQMEFAPDGESLYATRSEPQPGRGTLHVLLAYHLPTKKERLLFSNLRNDGVVPFAVSGDGRWLAYTNARRTLSIWDNGRGGPLVGTI